jgi:hypothetical protein
MTIIGSILAIDGATANEGGGQSPMKDAASGKFSINQQMIDFNKTMGLATLQKEADALSWTKGMIDLEKGVYGNAANVLRGAGNVAEFLKNPSKESLGNLIQKSTTWKEGKDTTRGGLFDKGSLIDLSGDSRGLKVEDAPEKKPEDSSFLEEVKNTFEEAKSTMNRDFKDTIVDKLTDDKWEKRKGKNISQELDILKDRDKEFRDYIFDLSDEDIGNIFDDETAGKLKEMKKARFSRASVWFAKAAKWTNVTKTARNLGLTQAADELEFQSKFGFTEDLDFGLDSMAISRMREYLKMYKKAGYKKPKQNDAQAAYYSNMVSNTDKWISRPTQKSTEPGTGATSPGGGTTPIQQVQQPGPGQGTPRPQPGANKPEIIQDIKKQGENQPVSSKGEISSKPTSKQSRESARQIPKLTEPTLEKSTGEISKGDGTTLTQEGQKPGPRQGASQLQPDADKREIVKQDDSQPVSRGAIKEPSQQQMQPEFSKEEITPESSGEREKKLDSKKGIGRQLKSDEEIRREQREEQYKISETSKRKDDSEEKERITIPTTYESDKYNVAGGQEPIDKAMGEQEPKATGEPRQEKNDNIIIVESKEEDFEPIITQQDVDKSDDNTDMAKKADVSAIFDAGDSTNLADINTTAVADTNTTAVLVAAQDKKDGESQKELKSKEDEEKMAKIKKKAEKMEKQMQDQEDNK